MKTNKKIGIWPKVIGGLILFVLLFIIASFYKMGMFEDVTLNEVSSDQRIILGKKYEGKLENEEFKQLFLKVGSLQQSGEVEGKVCGVYFNNPEKNKGQIKAIIGIVVKDSLSHEKPSDFSYFVLPAREVIQAYVHADFRVATIKTYSAIFDYAEEKSIPITDHYFEWLESPTDVFVEVSKK